MNPFALLALGAIVWSFHGSIGWLIARGKGRGKAGFWWSFFLGWIGWIIAALLKPTPAVEAEHIAAVSAHLNRSSDAGLRAP